MNSLQAKKAIFYPTEIIFFKRKEKIIINVNDIDRIDYVKPTLLNYLLASTWFGGTYPGRLQIYLNKKVYNTKLFLTRIKYKEVLQLPEFYLKKIDPTNKFGLY